MEGIEARALKSSFLSEIIGMKSNQQASFEDFLCVAGINNVVNHVSADEFSVDDLLDLSDKDFGDSGEGSSEDDFVSVSSPDNDRNSMSSGGVSGTGDLVSFPAGQLSVPFDDMESLEWLSQIVDDSASELSFLCPPASFNEVSVTRFEPVRTFTVLGLPHPVPRKSRTHRSRKPGRVWRTGSSSLTESSYSSTTSSHDSDLSITPPILFTNPFHPVAAKKQKKNPVSETEPGSGESLMQRRCTHCQVQKTPQWRTGPLGPKTLCNACGVRFKSGRLFPEYRPACSPTFSGEVHSNSHRKVLEMRKKKETEVTEPGLGLGKSVQCF